ncbi:P-loop containing nucleoside triphosphate hydrolase protein, partial [Flammula alnicola]
LIVGTLRDNLDPFEQHGDEALNDALRSAGLPALQEASDASISLDTEIVSGGSNLSVGQRQIIALARAILRGSKPLILDEGRLQNRRRVIQRSLRTELNKDATSITVAHRLQTIIDADNIMVLDDARIAEFNSPKYLLRKEQGILRALVGGNPYQDVLYELAENERK